MVKLKVFFLFILLIPFLAISQTISESDYDVTWIANSGGIRKSFVQSYIIGCGVSEDGIIAGTCFWDEGGRGLGLYGSESGEILNPEWDNRNAGVNAAINKKYVFTAGTKDIQRRLITKTTVAEKTVTVPDIQGVTKVEGFGSFYKDPATADRFRKSMGITGISANEMFVTAAVYATNKVYIYNIDLELQGTVSVERPVYATPTKNGGIWVIQGADSKNTPKIIEYDASGKPTGKMISEGLSDPRSLQVNSFGKLVVGDNGMNQQVFFYNITGPVPRLEKTFGQKGGIIAGKRGEVKPDKFNGIVYAGTDSNDNLYVVTGREGAVLRKFDKNFNMIWERLGLAFVDMIGVDPYYETDVYSKEERYYMDYSKSKGQEQRYVACTKDADRYPEDPRLHASLDGGVLIVRINGKKFMYVGEMYSGFIFIYRFNETIDGEIAIPCGAVSNRVSWQWEYEPWPPHQPPVGAFIWRDKNGNGRFDADEYENVTYQISLANVDEKGTIYFNGSLNRLECQGLDEIGNPVYSFKTQTRESNPQPFYSVKKVVYDAIRDLMFITGNSDDANSTSSVGPVFAVYPDWSKGNRKAAWSAVNKGSYTGFAARNGYIFAAYDFDNSNTDVFSAKDGKKVGTLSSKELGQLGWIDIPWGLFATQRANGEYLIFREEDYLAKTVLWRWNPHKGDTEKPAKPSNLAMQSRTSTSATIAWAGSTTSSTLAGYDIYVNGVKNNLIIQWDPLYTIKGLNPSTVYNVYVKARSFAGQETASDPIKVNTFPKDNKPPVNSSTPPVVESQISSIKLTWQPATDNIGVTGYDLFLNGKKTGYDLITKTTYLFEGLRSGTEYVFDIIAYDDAGNASPKVSVKASTLADNEPPTKPVLYATTLASSSELAVYWRVSVDNSKVSHYIIYNGDEVLVPNVSAGDYMGAPLTGNNLAYKIVGLKEGHTYNLSVSGVDESGNKSERSNVITMTTDSEWSRILDFEEADRSGMGHNLYEVTGNVSGLTAGMMKQRGYIEWIVDLPKDTTYRFITNYATMETMKYNMGIDVNGERVADFTLARLPEMSSWGDYRLDPNIVTANLKAGRNLIRLNSLSNYAPNLDMVKITYFSPNTKIEKK